MSWDLEQLAAHEADMEQRRPTEVANAPRPVQYPFIVTSPRVPRTEVTPEASQRPQPRETPARAAPRATTRPSTAGNPSVGGSEHVEPGETRNSTAPRAATSDPTTNNRSVRATGRSQPDEQQALATPRPATRPSTADPRVRTSGNLASTENHAWVRSEAVGSSTLSDRASNPAAQETTLQSRAYQPHQIQYPVRYRAPTHGQYGGVYNYHDGQYPPGLGFGNNGNQGGNGIHGAHEGYGTQGTSGYRGSQSARGYLGAQSGGGENSPSRRGTSVEFGGVTRSHSRPSNEATASQVSEPHSHNIQSQNQIPTEQPSYTTQHYFEVSGLESSYMPPQGQQQGSGNPGFHLPTMNDEASGRNTYGFPPQMPAPMNMQMPMQMPPPGGYNAFQNDPIPRPQTQIYNPFPQPGGAPYGPPPPGPQPGYYPHSNGPPGPPSPMPPLMSASSVPDETMTLDMVTHHSVMPFENGPLNHRPDPWGVAKIKNIPYAVTKQEIVHFIGRNSKMITPDLGCAIHIIMERSTSKTMDCYVEFMTQADADAAVAKINRIYETGRIPRLGSRHVDVEVSSQDALLKDLFPRAKQIIWKNGVPHLSPNGDPYSTGFQGFFTHEEIFLLIRHAEHPQRSPFSVKCLWRAYECTISTLKKFPWFATNMYTVEDRNQLFTVTLRHITALLPKIEKSKVVGLDRKLLAELLEAGLKCPGFNERQKFALVMASKVSTEHHRLSATARYWPFDTLSMKANSSDATMMHYANLIQKGLAVKDPSTQTLANSYHPQYQGESPFGRIWLEWGFNNTYHKFQAAVEYELQLVRSLVLEGYTANPMAAGPVAPDSASRNRQGGGNSGAHLAPPAHPPPQNFNARFSVSSPFFPPSGSPLPTQMGTIPPGSIPPVFSHGPNAAGPHPHQSFNMPPPQVQQQQHVPNVPATATTAPTTTTSVSPNVNIGAGNGGAGRGGRSNSQSRNQNQNQNQNKNQHQNQSHHQGQGHGHGHAQGQSSNHRSNRHPNNQGRHNNANNNSNNNSQKKRH